jgi:hypothetical protein
MERLMKRIGFTFQYCGVEDIHLPSLSTISNVTDVDTIFLVAHFNTLVAC